MRRISSLSTGAALATPRVATPGRATYRGEAIKVRSDNGVPVRLEWRGRLAWVKAVEATWCVEGRWWMDETRRGAKRRYYRLQADFRSGRTLVLEVFRSRGNDASPDEWRVWRVAD